MRFLDLQPDAFGIDISTRSLKVAQLKRTDSSFELAGYGEVGIPSAIIEETMVSDSKKLVDLIKQGRASKGIDTDYVLASLPEEKAFLEIIQMPKMKEEEIEKAVKYEAENYIPMSMEEVYFDSEVIQPVVDSLDHTDVLITALPKEVVDPYVDCLKEAGLIPVALEVETQAIARALIKDFISSKPLLLVDLGATRTTIMVYSGRALRFTAYIPISSRQFTKVISERLDLGFEQAEQLKIKHGLGESGEAKKITGALKPALNDLEEQMESHLEYYHTHSFHEHLPAGEAGRISKILLTGGGSNLKGLPEFLSGQLGIPAELGNPWVNILSQDLKQVPEMSFQQSLKYTVALGLALRGVL